MIKSGKFKIGSLIAVAMLLAGSNASVTAMTYQEFKDAPVTDSRREASCHNFADNGAFYEFKIIGGHVYYSKEGGLPSEYAFDAGRSSAVYLDYKTTRAGTKTNIPAAGFEMITARNNRLLAKLAGSNMLFWSGIVMEYGKDYDDGTSWVDVPGTYSKVDPQEYQGPGNPFFWANPHNHFGSSLFSNNNSLALLPDCLKFLDGKLTLPGAPDLEWVSTTNFVKTLTTDPGPIMKDVMEVCVLPRLWYLIDATPPRNGLNASVSQLSANNGYVYQEHKRKVAKQLSAYMVKVATGLVDEVAVGGVNLIEFRKFFTDAVNIAADVAKAPLVVMSDRLRNATIVAAFFGSPTAAAALTTHYTNVAARATIDATANTIKSNINNISVAKYLEPIELFYNTNVDFAIDLPDYLANNPVALALKIEEVIATNSKDLKDGLFYAVCGENRTTLLGKVSQLFVSEIEEKTNDFADQFTESFRDFNLEKFLPPEMMPNAANVDLGWVNVVLGLNRWYKYFKYPSDVFEMEDINLKTVYQAAGNEGTFIKTQVKIKKIIDLGIAQSCRYEHYRMHHGGEWGTFFGEITSPESWDLKTSDENKPLNLFSAFDGHGFNDGTCNFYLLAEIGIWDPALGKYVDKPVLLWIDEQEYFAERWHVFHPRDNVFEGLAGTLGSAFTSLTILKGLDIQNFAKNFWTPYQQLTSDARMATSGTATVIAGDFIYSASMYWALTDKTWRWRNYPAISEAAGESIDKKSVTLRDDMTITFRGKKNVHGTVVDGYWYQRYLDPNNRKTPGSGDRFTHPWRFMEKDAFDVANKNYYRMGMYEQVTELAGNPSQHYSYKGYTPRTHIYTFKTGAMVTWRPAGGAAQTIGVNTFVNNAYDPNNVYRVSLNQDGSKPITSPMYSTMKVQHGTMVPTVKLRFGKTNDGLVYACFADIRDDDVKLPVELNNATTFYCRPDNGTNAAIAITTADLLSDLNVWADAPIDQIDITHNSTNETFGFKFTLNNCERYKLTNLKVGYINGGTAQTLATIPLGVPVISGTGADAAATYTSTGNGISKALWETCFSEEGRAKYGTNVWVVDAFGNGNTIENIASVGVPAPSITVSAKTSNQPVTFAIQNAAGAGSVTKVVWNFGDGTPEVTVTSLTPPAHRYARPGTYVATVTAVGPDFPDVKKLTITVRANLLPIRTFMLE